MGLVFWTRKNQNSSLKGEIEKMAELQEVLRVIAEADENLVTLRRENLALQRENEDLRRRIKELERRLGETVKDSDQIVMVSGDGNTGATARLDELLETMTIDDLINSISAFAYLDVRKHSRIRPRV